MKIYEGKVLFDPCNFKEGIDMCTVSMYSSKDRPRRKKTSL